MSKGVYLLCFAHQPYKHAKHYLGYADDISRRIEEHRRGQGARLTVVIHEAGIEFVVARLWEGADRKFERKVKNTGHIPQYCPICREKKRRDK